jgi:hypothetical protein
VGQQRRSRQDRAHDLASTTKLEGEVCVSSSLNYVSVINDNNLVSLINFNVAKVN